MIKAIETKYKGYRFRSRLEARWAVFFDALGIQWEYEKEGYTLDNGMYYLPDFWLPQFESWFEVKGVEGDSEKAEMLARDKYPVILAEGNIGDALITLFCNDLTESTGGYSSWEGTFAPNGFFTEKENDRSFCDAEWKVLEWVNPNESVPFALINKAYERAREARF